MTDQGWVGSDSHSLHSNSNMFHPRGGLNHSLDQSETGSIHQLSNAKAAAREARAQKEADKDKDKQKIAEEWGFEREETMAIWEARARKKQAGKKKNIKLTADEKLKRFQAMTGRK